MKFGVKSDKGIVREINEDSFNVISGYTGIPDVFIVADGMGGHNSGEIASKMAVDLIGSYILQHPEVFSDENNITSVLKNMMEEANREIFNKSKEQEGTYGMGTTLTIAVMLGGKLFVGHVGDSRLYLIRKDIIERITTDHSYIEELIKNGSITRKEAAGHPNRNIITRALGCETAVEVDTYTCDIHQGELFLLCTDGLTNKLEEDEIKAVISENDELQLACDSLVSKAIEKGGEDNITAILVKKD